MSLERTVTLLMFPPNLNNRLPYGRGSEKTWRAMTWMPTGVFEGVPPRGSFALAPSSEDYAEQEPHRRCNGKPADTVKTAQTAYLWM